MSTEHLKKLVDLYAGEELPQELVDEMEAGAMEDPALSHDMFTLRHTVKLLQSTDAPAFSDESHYRILMKMQAQGADVASSAPEPSYIQYHLQIRG